MSNFRDILRRSKKSLAKDLRYSESDAQLLYRLLQEFWKVNEEASNSEAFEYFQNLFIKENEDIATFPLIKSNNIKYFMCKYVVEHPEVLKEAYDQIIAEEESSGVKKTERETDVYDSNMLSAIRSVTLEGLVTLRKEKAGLNPKEVKIIEDYMKAPKSMQKKYRNSATPAQRRAIDAYLTLLSGDEFTQLHKFLTDQVPILCSDLRSDYVESILRVSEKLDKFGLLEKYNEMHKNTMSRIGLSGLSYEYDQDASDSPSIKSFFQRKNIEKMDIYQLSALNAFLVNRYTKELDGLNKTFFIVDELGLWHKIRTAKPSKSGRISIDIDEKELEALYRKMNFLDVALTDLMGECAKAEDLGEEQNVTMENGSVRKFVRINVSEKIEEMREELGDDYAEFFGEILPDSSNFFSREFDNYRILRNATINTYRIKDYNMLSTLFNLYQVKGVSKNWGVILEGKPIQECSKILLGFDIEGFNMPIRLHIDRAVVEDFLKANQGTTKMPVYEGASDFEIAGQNIGTNMLMPLFMKQKRALKATETEEARCIYDTSRFISHIKFLKDSSKYPEHLKTCVVEKKKGHAGVRKVRPARKFLDLATGEEFVEQKDGSLIPFTPSEQIREK